MLGKTHANMIMHSLNRDFSNNNFDLETLREFCKQEVSL